MDAIDFREKAGKVTLLPLNNVLNNAALSHKFLPIVSGLMTYRQLKNAYMLGIQPESIDSGNRISAPVRKAMNDVLTILLNLNYS
jgi:Ni,Fe-hydrogenase maturation factor